MLDPEKQSKLDQDVAEIRESFPRTLWALYEGCVEQGFTKEQAMQIVTSFISRRADD